MTEVPEALAAWQAKYKLTADKFRAVKTTHRIKNKSYQEAIHKFVHLVNESSPEGQDELQGTSMEIGKILLAINEVSVVLRAAGHCNTDVWLEP